MTGDKQLEAAVLAELAWEPSVEAAHIGVAVHEGVVTLSGHVGSFLEKHMTEVTVGRVKGVRAVAEGIEVRLPAGHRRDDEAIAAAALARLDWEAAVPKDSIKIKVENGWLSLAGQVDWHYQKEAAESAVRRLLGLAGVTNQVTIRPKVDASRLSDDIVHALHRSWFFDPKTITVAVNDGRITLSGTATSRHDRQIAAATAWSSPGATSVQNNITVV